MKVALFVIVALLAVIAYNLQASSSREADERHARAEAASAYLHCAANAKDPSLCPRPE